MDTYTGDATVNKTGDYPTDQNWDDGDNDTGDDTVMTLAMTWYNFTNCSQPQSAIFPDFFLHCCKTHTCTLNSAMGEYEQQQPNTKIIVSLLRL